jgi:hypothetical protein
LDAETANSAPAQTSSTVPNLTQDEVDDLTEQLHVMYLPDIPLSAQDKADLDHICHLTNAEAQLVRLMGNEVETVNTEKWNHDAAVQLINLTKSLKGKGIPFSRREDMFDLQPTATDQTVAEVPGSIHSGKGKERAADNPTPKRSIYHVLPQNAKESWLGAAGASKYILARFPLDVLARSGSTPTKVAGCTDGICEFIKTNLARSFW